MYLQTNFFTIKRQKQTKYNFFFISAARRPFRVTFRTDADEAGSGIVAMSTSVDEQVSIKLFFASSKHLKIFQISNILFTPVCYKVHK